MKRLIVVCMLFLGILMTSACSSKDEAQIDSTTDIEASVSADDADSVVIITPTEAPEKSTIVESGTGEAEASAELPDLTEYTEHKVGEVITVNTDEQTYDLVIDSVEYIEPTNEHEEKPENVILVTYTYTNHSEELLLIDNIRFQLMNMESETLYDPYYFQEKLTAEPAAMNQSQIAQVAFEQNGVEDSVVLVYQDIANEDVNPIMIVIENIGEGE